MPKAASDKPTRSAGEKGKRAPSAYALFVKEQMPIWKEKNPGRKHTEAMKEIAGIWKDHASNPNAGAAGAEKKKAPAKKAPPKKKAKKVESEEEEGSAGDDE